MVFSLPDDMKENTFAAAHNMRTFNNACSAALLAWM